MLGVSRLRPQDIHNSIVAKVASAIAIVVGGLILIISYLKIKILQGSFLGIEATIQPDTALCFFLSGISLWLLVGMRRRKFSYLSRICAVAVGAIASLTLSKYLLGWNLGIDDFLQQITQHQGGMGWNTSISFILLSLALQLLVHPTNKRSYWYAQIFTLMVAVISLQVVIGCVYRVKFFYSPTSTIPSMGFYTALLLIVLCVGILWGRAEQGLMKIVISDSYGGSITRRLLVAAIAFPVILGWLIVEGQRAGKYGTAYAVSVFAVVLIVIFAIVIWQSAVIIELLSQQRDRAEKTVKVYEEKLRSFVDANLIGIIFSDVYGGIEKANNAFLEMIGYSQEDLLAGKLSWRDITPPEYLHLDEQSIAEAKANPKGACTPYEKEYIHKDGSRIPVLVGYVLTGETKEEAVAFIFDLRESKQAQAEQQKLVSLIENSNDFIGLATLEGESFYLNNAGQKLVGLRNLEEVKQKVVSDYVMPQDQAYFLDQILPTVITKGDWHGEFFFRHFQTSQAIPVDYHVFTIKDHNTGEPIALATVTRNITEQKQSQEKILQLNKDLQRRVAELQTLLEVIPIGIGIAEDALCQNIKVNPALAKQLGISPDVNASLTAPIEEKPTQFKVYRGGRELLPEELPMQYAAAHGVEVLDFEVDIIHDNGNIVNLLEYVAPLFDEEGNTRGAIGAFLDITERKQAEELLRNQQQWLEYVLNLMPRPLLFIEPGTARVIFANRAADELAGGEFPRGIPGADYHTAYYCTDADGNQIPNDQMPGVKVARGERLEGYELDWHTPNGILSILVFADTLPALHGYPATCVLVFQDITKLKQAEKALSLGYKRLQLLFSTANELLSSQEPLALIDSCFHKLAEQIGLDTYFNYLMEENSQGMRLASHKGISEELAQEIGYLSLGQAVCGVVAQQCQSIYVENVQQSTDSKTELVRSIGLTAYYCSPLIAQGKILGTLGFGSRTRNAFTENQKGMMKAVCDQIAIAMERTQLITSLQQQTEQLTAANRMKDEFLAILSHELRSPLNAILGWSQLLRTRQLSETQTAKGLETIERNAKAQTQLIEDLLDISRMIRGKLHLNVYTCNLVPIIESAIENIKIAAQAKEIDLQFSLFPQSPENTQFLISGDSERLQQIIWNLLANAIKFTPTSGKVEVRLSKVEGSEHETKTAYVQIQVIDTGIGINSSFLPYVFDRFRQADSSSTRSHGGLGLGLAIVRHLVELHGGTVHVYSPGEQQGATFTVKLPLLAVSKLTLTEPVNQSAANASPLPMCPSLSGVRVLVVDDEADSRNFASTVLEQCQAEVQAVDSVQAALEMINQWQPDVLVSDIGMPNEDGYALIRKLRSLPPEKGGKIPAAALTAYARADDRTRAIQEGYQLHLPKPIEPIELATVVASLIDRNK
ncbi:hybrid sensor histidine kinase/response regulator [Nostoc sp. UHCC 0870]|uniref:hybrid sensor histidine kinase/response regulator n=1 Tax=Nostoc sp. UHCC 0870 TaxID=2914041 RepID=UPI001EDCAC82|nr:PAS domain S-box protein [Nostoc sp. UHCC 0870]UKO98246.1 PAS domain S-box protein [Nostoc sp. UHCC 0870]